MNTGTENSETTAETSQLRKIKIIGVGGAGVALADAMNCEEFSGAQFAAIDTDEQSLAVSTATVKIHLETKLMRGLGTGGDSERGRALAEQQFPAIQSACEGANVIFIVAGLGGGAGSGIAPVVARAAKETGALVLGFVAQPFQCEGNRRAEQAQQSLEQLKTIADGVICLPCQKAFKLIDENTSVLETFRITGGLLIEGVRGIWQLLTRPSLIQIHFEDLCKLVRDQHSQSSFAYVEATGPARSREIVEKLLKHPLLDEGRALGEANAILVSMTAGKDLTMAEVNRVMEQIVRHCDHPQIIMGAAIDVTMKNKLSVTLIAAKNSAPKIETTNVPEETALRETSPRYGGRQISPTSSLTLEQREQTVRRGRRGNPKMLQTQLPLAIVSKGRFDKSEPTIYRGEDLDIPTYIRRGVPLN
jgi:cell division protein FtsZ